MCLLLSIRRCAEPASDNSKTLSITGLSLPAPNNGQTFLNKSEASDLFKKVWPLLGAGRLNPVIDSVFELSDAGSAHLLMESSKHIGKILLKVEQ